MADHNSNSSSSKIMYLSIALAVVLMALVVPFAQTGKGSSGDSGSSDDVEARIAPIAKIELQAGPAGEKDGKTVFTTVCTGCHGTGAMGAPKFGDKAAWAPRIGQGIPTLLKHALNGYKGMPARGGVKELSDDEVKAGIEYMVSGSK